MRSLYNLIKPFLALKIPRRVFYGPCVIAFVFFAMAQLETQAQQRSKITITGSVTDTLGVKMPNVNVVAENRKNVATSTDENGKFVLDVDPGTVLRFSFVNFREQRVTINADTKILSIVMHENKSSLEDVVVLAYGKKQRREAVVGSVTSVKPGDLKIPASNLTNALAGQVAGVIAYQRSGQPGQDNASFFIRGVTTFGYKVDPLILIDNVELTASDLARLQVDDIASFSILKDASATALYGARGANGVILVSTKEGKTGPAKINFRIENSISQSTKTLQLADPITYMKLYNEATVSRNKLVPVPFDQNKILGTQAALNNQPGSNKYVFPAVDWMDMLFKNRTTTQRGNLSVSGGGGVARYYVAGSYNLDHGILKEDPNNNNDNNVKFQNYQLRSNVNINVTKTTELIVRLSGNFNEYNGPLTADGTFSTDLYNYAVHTSPVLFPAYFPADSANLNAKHILFGNVPASDGSINYTNPYAALLRGHKNSSESRMSAQLELNQNLNFITDGLSFHSIFNTNRYSFFDSQRTYKPFYYNYSNYNAVNNTYTLNWLNPQANAATEYLDYLGGNAQVNTFYYLQASADYSRRVGKSNLSATLIGTGQQTLYFVNQGTLFNSLPYRNFGLAGRATYSLLDRYFAEFNFGYNGSERFSENHRYGFFPTIGAGWLVSGEKFWGGSISKIIDRLKVRGSYGLVGNDAIGSQRFFYLSDVNLDGGNFAYFGNTNGYFRNGVSIRNYANPDVTWETSRQLNLAMELTLFKNLNITAEVYKNHRYNILQTRTSPASLGLEAPISSNIGQVDSKGIDLSTDYKQTFNNGLWASVRGNFTFASNKYKYFDEPAFAEPWRYAIGQSINTGVGYIAERLFVDDQEVQNSPKQIFSAGGTPPKAGDIKYRDLNGDGMIDKSDETWLGYPQTPEIVYGFGFSTGYKGFDLSAFFQGQARVSFFIDPNNVSPFIPGQSVGGNTQLLKSFADDHWSPENQNLYALYPRMGTNRTDLENNLQNSTWWMRDGSFIRLKSVEIGYTLPSGILRSMKLSNCRIYFNGLNLLTWSKFKLWDPEQGGAGFNYPVQKVFNIGLNVNL